MVALRATKKVLRLLPAAYTGSEIPPPTNALGDWYINRLVVDRQPLLLLVSAESLLSILAPARNVRTLPDRLGDLVGRRLRRLGIADAIVDAEQKAMGEVLIGPTASRSVVGTMVDFAKSVPWYLADPDWIQDAATALNEVESRMGDTPCKLNTRPDTIWPEELATELLIAQYG